MGYTLRTSTFRYTAWVPFKPKINLPDWKHIIAEELYDHDIDKGENRNVVSLKKYDKLRKELRILLQSGWKNVLPHNFNV